MVHDICSRDCCFSVKLEDINVKFIPFNLFHCNKEVKFDVFANLKLCIAAFWTTVAASAEITMTNKLMILLGFVGIR